jgi:hypothetical protein
MRNEDKHTVGVSTRVCCFLAVVAAFCAAMELAFRLGRRHSARSDDTTRSHVTGLQAALLVLLALLLGFNFAMAVARFDARKALLQEEVNAINTTYLRAASAAAGTAASH